MAWSRPEKLIAGGFALLLVTSILTAGLAYRDWKTLRHVHVDFWALEGACREYYKAYQHWPIRPDIVSDVRFGKSSAYPNSLVMNVLLSVDGPGNPGHALNPEKKKFIEIRKAKGGVSGLAANGSLVDPWGSPYQIIVDANNDGTCDLPEVRFGSAVNTRVAIWSYGADGKADTLDDIISWAD